MLLKFSLLKFRLVFDPIYLQKHHLAFHHISPPSPLQSLTYLTHLCAGSAVVTRRRDDVLHAYSGCYSLDWKLCCSSIKLLLLLRLESERPRHSDPNSPF